MPLDFNQAKIHVRDPDNMYCGDLGVIFTEEDRGEVLYDPDESAVLNATQLETIAAKMREMEESNE